MDNDAVLRQARRLSVLLKALANERRIQILCLLREGEKSVSELENLVNLSQSALSQHLAKLRRDKIVKTRREAQTIFYSLKGPCDELGDAVLLLHAMCCFLEPKRVAGQA